MSGNEDNPRKLQCVPLTPREVKHIRLALQYAIGDSTLRSELWKDWVRIRQWMLPYAEIELEPGHAERAAYYGTTVQHSSQIPRPPGSKLGRLGDEYARVDDMEKSNE